MIKNYKGNDLYFPVLEVRNEYNHSIIYIADFREGKCKHIGYIRFSPNWRGQSEYYKIQDSEDIQRFIDYIELINWIDDDDRVECIEYLIKMKETV